MDCSAFENKKFFRLQLDFTVAVDFTASNGTVTDPRSLHYINPHQPNQYEMAIRAVLDICQFYNKTKMFDAYGFGAKIPPTFQVSHLFPLVSFVFFNKKYASYALTFVNLDIFQRHNLNSIFSEHIYNELNSSRS